VLDNLVKNALEAIDQGPGMVKLATNSLAPEKVEIIVQDSGPGVPETMNVFQLFETTKRNGTGLGLAIARQIVTAHGGEIDFERLMPSGTVFRIGLPRNGIASV
jgi:signal transduction histidine kinase